MKRLAQIMIVFSTLSATVNIIAKTIKQSESEMLGQQVVRELGDKVRQANMVFKAAVTENEKQDASKDAHEAAQTLVNTLNDIKTFGSDVTRGYNPAQRRLAAITLAEMLMRENSLNAEIKGLRMEIKDMTDPNSWFSFAKSGKSEPRTQTEKEIKQLHEKRKNVRKAISDQEAILGLEWSDTIKLAINNLNVGNSYGIGYGIDWYFGSHGAKLMTEKNQRAAGGSKKSKAMHKQPLTHQQKAAIKSWHHVRKNKIKNKILSQEITTAYELTQAKELLSELNAIKDDLKDIPSKHKHVLDKVCESADSLSRKIDRARTRWLK